MEHLPVPASPIPSAYEQQAWHEIGLWKNPDRGWFGRAVGALNGMAHRATDLLRKIPGIDWIIDNVVAGLVKLVNEIVQDTVSEEGILGDYRKAGIPVTTRADIEALDLERVDRLARHIAGKYRAAAAVEGAVTGYAGAAGIATDIVALVSINLRAAGEYAACCGFDISDPSERLFALQILDAMSHPSDLAKQLTLTPVIRASGGLARRQVIDAAEQYAVVRAMRNAARALGIHLTEVKMAQLVPAAGAVIGSGFNAYYTSKVCDAAFFLYRERFLLRKYGSMPR